MPQALPLRLLPVLACLISPAGADETGQFTAHDLARLDCEVNPDAGGHETLSVPTVGDIRTYEVSGKTPCKVRLISQIRPSPDPDFGTWAGRHASVRVLAKNKGNRIEERDVALGEIGELHCFFRQGERVGFAYLIQHDGPALSVTVFSKQVVPGPNVEALLAAALTASPR